MEFKSKRQHAEAFVLVREENMRLRYPPIKNSSIEVRSHSNENHPDRIVYTEGIDYEVNYDNGTIRRTAGSRIPDGAHHVMYGISNFDHALFADCSNRDFTVYVDYSIQLEERLSKWGNMDGSISGGMERWTTKLRDGKETLWVVYGDSISAGGEASEDKFTFYNRFTQYMNGLYPDSRITLINKAIGGEASDGGRQRIDRDVVSLHPDLISIGYGMNDQNMYKEGIGVSLLDFERNYRAMIEAVQQVEDCDIVLVTPCSPNPLWRYTSGQIGKYADVIRRLGSEYRIGVADVHALWEQELAAGKTPESLLLNNINHPNDYGHMLYFKAFLFI